MDRDRDSEDNAGGDNVPDNWDSGESAYETASDTASPSESRRPDRETTESSALLEEVMDIESTEESDGDYEPMESEEDDENDENMAWYYYPDSQLYNVDDEENDPDMEIFSTNEDVDEEDDEDDQTAALFAIIGNTFQLRLPRPHSRVTRQRKPRPGQQNLEPVPSEEGRELMASGDFGYSDLLRSRKRRRRTSASESPSSLRSPPPCSQGTDSRIKNPGPLLATYKKRPPIQDISRQLLHREMGFFEGETMRIAQQVMSQSLIPQKLDKIVHFNARCYSGQFAQDGDFFYCCSQNMKVKMYDTTNPYNWKYYKTEYYPGGRWTITDACLTPDNNYIAYSSIDSSVYMASTNRDEELITHLDFCNGSRRHAMDPGTGIWSIRFSGDSSELVAGSSDANIYVYDIETGRTILKLPGHTNDVNAVCYGDSSSPHLLFSGSDDTTIRVWDRRSLASGREAGVFCGHTEGLTYIDAKGDGRYVLSNGKDQTMKLWDIRKMIDRSTFENLPKHFYGYHGFDYRFDTYDKVPVRRHPNDCSVVTFRGHSVLRTLIRCHFSPPVASGARYVYTGSEDGRIHIYNLDATVAAVIDVQSGTYNTRPKQPGHQGISSVFLRSGSEWKSCVRDVSWHPNAPVIAASAWGGYGTDGGTVTVHSWDGCSPDWNTPPVRKKMKISKAAGGARGTAAGGSSLANDDDDGYESEDADELLDYVEPERLNEDFAADMSYYTV